jgi:hypothetical protein
VFSSQILLPITFFFGGGGGGGGGITRHGRGWGAGVNITYLLTTHATIKGRNFMFRSVQKSFSRSNFYCFLM